jgi:tetratricopeptide (TPR) repeat protein
MMFGRRAPGAVVVACVLTAAAACGASRPAPPRVVTAPKFPDYPTPFVPQGLAAPPAVQQRHHEGWQRLQAGDLRGASRDFNEVLQRAPDFYPSHAALGFVELADRDPKGAAPHFAAAVERNDRYLPAWVGRAEALLALGEDAEAIRALERILQLDPQREGVRSRLDLVRFRALPTLIESGRKARSAGRLEEAERQFAQALELSPTSTMILQELSAVALQAGRFADAEAHARTAIKLEPKEAVWHAALGEALEAQGKLREAGAAFASAAAIEPRAKWRKRTADLNARARLAALPPEFAAIASSPSVTRAQTAAFIGIELEDLIARAPRRVTAVATDVRNHWATPWILPVTQAGIMSVFANHTFQPSATIRRSDLAAIGAELVRLALGSRRAELTRLQAARPKFPDVPSTHLSYRSAALAITAGVMTTDPAGRFEPTRPASGADLVEMVRRVQALAGS